MCTEVQAALPFEALCRQAAELAGFDDNCGCAAEHLGGLLHVWGALQPLGEGLQDREAGSSSPS